MRRLGKEQYQFWNAPYPQYAPDFYAISQKYPLPEEKGPAGNVIFSEEEIETNARKQIHDNAQHIAEKISPSQLHCSRPNSDKMQATMRQALIMDEKQSLNHIRNEDDTSSLSRSIETNFIQTESFAQTLSSRLNSNVSTDPFTLSHSQHPSIPNSGLGRSITNQLQIMALERELLIRRQMQNQMKLFKNRSHKRS